jgi:dTDP-4-amino-4,6-dideoxygalactose transaminase
MLLIPRTHGSIDHAYHLYPLQIYLEKLPFTKPQFFKEMNQAGIKLQVHYIPIHTQPFYKNKYGFEFGDFPVSENFYYRVVSIPLYPSLTHTEVEKVVADISSFAKSH